LYSHIFKYLDLLLLGMIYLGLSLGAWNLLYYSF